MLRLFPRSFRYFSGDTMQQGLIDTIHKIIPVDEQQAALISRTFKLARYKKNERLLQSGAVAHEVYFVIKGLLLHYYIDDTGCERTCDFVFPNEFVTDLESFIKKKPASSYIKALYASECLTISCNDLTYLMKESHVAHDYFNMVVENIATESMRRTKSLLTLSPEQRFMEVIRERPTIFQAVPQRYIAQYLGIAPESLSRIKKRLMKGSKS